MSLPDSVNPQMTFPARSRIGGRVMGMVLTAVAMAACTTVPPSRPTVGPTGDLSLRPDDVREPDQTAHARALAWFSLALSHELEGDLPSALDAYRRAIEEDPDNDTLYMIASERFMDTGQEEAAFELLNILLRRNPDNVRALRWMARLHLERDEPEKALPLLKRAIALRPRSEVPYLRAIEIELENGNADEVLRIARLAVEHAEKPEQSTRLLAEILLRKSGQAVDLISTQRYRDEAEALLADAIDAFPGNEEFPLVLAGLRIREKRYGQALDLYETLDARSEDPSDTRARLLLHFLREAGADARAVTTVRSVLEEAGDRPLARYLTGLLEQNAGSTDRARAAFERALELAPGDQASQRKLALIYFQQDLPGRAARFLAEVLEENPRDTDLLTLAAHIHLAQENFEAAAGRFRQLDLLSRQGVELENTAQVQAGRAMALLAIGELDGAVDAMAQAAERVPESLEIIWRHQTRLAWRARNDDPERAERYSRDLLQALLDLADLRPDDPGVELLIANTHSGLRQYSESLRALDRVRILAEENGTGDAWLDADYHFDRGAALERTGQIEASVAAFRQVLDLEPNHAAALNYLSYMWAERGENLDEALRFVRKALEMDPDNGAYLDTLGWVYYQQENYEDAYRELLRAADQIPDESVVAEHLGDVLMKLGRPVEAVGYYRIALELDPKERLETVRSSLARAEARVAETIQAADAN